MISSLTTAAMRKIGRCDDCPPTYDPAVFESLRVWRGEVARALKVPAYVVFTDATLTALAESAPTELRGVAAVPGVGAMKLQQSFPSRPDAWQDTARTFFVNSFVARPARGLPS